VSLEFESRRAFVFLMFQKFRPGAKVGSRVVGGGKAAAEPDGGGGRSAAGLLHLLVQTSEARTRVLLSSSFSELELF
jgi:hypothetical protein